QRERGEGSCRSRTSFPHPPTASQRAPPSPARGRGAMSTLPLLTLLIAIPLIAGGIALFLNASGARWVALIATFIDFALSIELWANFDPNGPQWQFVENLSLGGGIGWALGIDGIALVLIALTA